MDKEILKEFLEKLDPEGETFSIHIEGEEDYTEIDWDKEARVQFGEDSVLFKWFMSPSDEKRIFTQNIIRLSKILSISVC